MYGRYAAGASLQNVADEFGLTREGVRQIFRSSGLPTRPQGATAKLKRARRKSESAEQICATFVGSNDPAQIAQDLVISESLVKEVLRERVPFAYRHRGRMRPRRYSDAELLSFLRSAAPHCATPLSTNAYRAFAAGRRAEGGCPWPAPRRSRLASSVGAWRWSKLACQPASRPPEAASSVSAASPASSHFRPLPRSWAPCRARLSTASSPALQMEGFPATRRCAAISTAGRSAARGRSARRERRRPGGGLRRGSCRARRSSRGSPERATDQPRRST